MPDTATAPVETTLRPFGDTLAGCDCHAHMIGDDPAFPLSPQRAEDPAPGPLDFWLDQYRAHLATLGLTRGVIVHSMLYGLDNAITAEAVRRLGRDNFRAVGLVDGDVSEQQLDDMAEAGFRGVRLNYVHGGVLDWAGTVALAPRLNARGMHVQILLHSDQHMAELAPGLTRLGCDAVIDHMGWPDMAAGPGETGFEQLLSLLGDGRIWLKLSGLYRFTDAPHDAADAFVERALTANPDRCIWGSDWPFIMLGGVRRPQVGDLAKALLRAIPDQNLRQAVLGDNPTRLFGF
ncbi:amidohydrolase family protein [Mameliella sediminis]|uniref:amidohydrolase family protein n=1 Tax=Mameliella sediminis TaxID=2836866 RepID=UPI001C47A4AB|nr:amidohydrolase family protein [Mameliella sediminis]MBV7394097.1 amidohydrolase family protein [Mameliella sediminis]